MDETETTAAIQPAREIWPAIWNGIKCRCPRCGKGKIFQGYLKIADECPACGQELFHHRADDGPPYIVIAIVGHILIGVMLHMELVMKVNPLTYFYTMIPLAIILPLLLLPPAKGGLVGLQWATRMHGFDPTHQSEFDA